MKKPCRLKWVVISCAILLSFIDAVYAFADSRLTLEEIKNAEYCIKDSEADTQRFAGCLSIGGHRVKFNNGTFESTSSGDGLKVVIGEVAITDFDDDGMNDAAVTLVSSREGHRTFYDIAILFNKNGRLMHAVTYSIRDSRQVISVTINESKNIDVKVSDFDGLITFLRPTFVINP